MSKAARASALFGTLGGLPSQHEGLYGSIQRNICNFNGGIAPVFSALLYAKVILTDVDAAKHHDTRVYQQHFAVIPPIDVAQQIPDFTPTFVANQSKGPKREIPG